MATNTKQTQFQAWTWTPSKQNTINKKTISNNQQCLGSQSIHNVIVQMQGLENFSCVFWHSFKTSSNCNHVAQESITKMLMDLSQKAKNPNKESLEYTPTIPTKTLQL